MEHSQKYKRGIKVKEDAVVFLFRKIFAGQALKAHIDMVNGAAMEYQNDN